MLALGPHPETLDSWLSRRERGEPLAWIVGHVDFLGRRLGVEHGVYVPRQQSCELASRASELLPAHGRAADLCTGSGAVGAALLAADPTAQLVATDIDPRAAGCARRNGVAVVLTDLDRGLRSDSFDVVTAVAPYVPSGEMHLLPADVQRFEPARALDGGPDGLDVVRRLVVGAARLLTRGGWLLTEIGGHQDVALAGLLGRAGFAAPTWWYDDDGDLRGLAAQLVDEGPRARRGAATEG